MARIFSIIAGLSALMVFLAGGGSYWFSSADAKSAKLSAATTVANSLASNLSQQLETLQASVDGLAQTPDIINALSSGNPDIIKATAQELQAAIPNILHLRLLLPDLNNTDSLGTPQMGYGDLEMARATLTGKPQPVIQGDAEDRHLAITSAVINNQQVIGVLLASLKADLPQRILSQIPIEAGLIEVKQDQLVLASQGQAVDKTDEPTLIPIQNSRWKIEAWLEVNDSLFDLSILTAIILLPALFACLAFFIGYRKLNDSFHQDQRAILKAAKDMIQGKTVGNYPMQLEEMQPIIAAMVQFKRVLNKENTGLTEHNENQELDFFDESFDLDFMEDSESAVTKHIHSKPISVTEMPVTMPVLDNFDLATFPAKATKTKDKAAELEGLDVGFLTQETQKSFTTAPITLPSGVDFAATPLTKSVPQQATDPFRAHEILGITGKNIDEELVVQIGQAFASEAWLHNVKTIVVARDTRLSSPGFSAALIKGITAFGCDVLDIGLVPTPVLYFVSHHTEGRTGVMVTGGDHAADYNGLKLILNDTPLSSEQILQLKRRIDAKDFNPGLTGSVEQNSLFSNEYIGSLAEDIHIVRPMTVVIDCANGATAKLGPTLFKTMGCDVVELYCDPDGQFPNHQPDPGVPENLEALIKAVKLNKADLGLAFDGAGEQMGLVDSNGRIIPADKLLMLYAREVLVGKPGAEIIFDTACSKHLTELIKKRGGLPLYAKSGPFSLHTKLRENGAILAGDISGHFLFNDRWFGFNDVLYAAARMIEMLSTDMRSSAELFDDLPQSITTPELHIQLMEGDNTQFLENLFSKANFNDAYLIDTDGMRVEFCDGWGLVRASNTFPTALSLRFEADSREVLKRIQAQFKTLLLSIAPDISLPF